MKYLRAGVRVAFAEGLLGVSGRSAWAFAVLLAASACNGRDVSQLAVSIQTGSDAGVVADTAAARCVPGQTLACMGVCGVPVGGYQVCAPDGRSYGQCTCPRGFVSAPESASRSDEGALIAPRVGGGSLGGSIWAGGASAAAGQPSAGKGDVGAACQLDSACSAGLTCLGTGSTELAGEGPAGGYCTKRCSAQTDCSALDPNAGCTSIAGQSLCVRLCAADGAGGKCLSRSDVSCVSAPALQQQTGQTGPAGAEQLGICAPLCQSDASCGGGRHCDLLTGLCSDQPASGDPIGSSCSGPDGCNGGVCLGASDANPGICSAFCTLGAAGCGFDGTEPKIGAACLLPQIQGEGNGNRGLCFELCDSDADCTSPAACLPSPSNGRAGVCLPPAPAGSGAPDVAVGAACTSDAACGAGGTCLLEGNDLFGIGGGPPGGYCSVQCQADTDCPNGGMCLGSAAEAYCFRSCDLSGGDPSGSDLSGGDLSGGDPSGGDECGGRAVLVCGALEATSLQGTCLPQCNADSDCSGGRFCDPQTGLCAAPAAPAGGCSSDADCTGGVCNTALGTCAAPGGCSGSGCGPIGGSCAVDGDCGSGRTCLRSDADPFGVGGGPAGGYCSSPCAADGDCAPDGLCVGTPAGLFCFRACDLTTSDDCGGRSDLICDALGGNAGASNARGFCRPQCQSDDECGDQQSCSPTNGLCVEPPSSAPAPAGDPSGECDGGVCGRDAGVAAPAALCTADADCPNQVCDPNVGQCVDPSVCSSNADCLSEQVCNPNAGLCIAAPPLPVGGACAVDTDCAVQGLCLALGDASFCSAVCEIGTAVGCEAYGSDSFCLLPLPNSTTLGVCLGLCNTPADCAQTGFDCLDIGGTLNGFTGACVPPAPPAATDPTPPAAAEPSGSSAPPVSPASG